MSEPPQPSDPRSTPPAHSGARNGSFRCYAWIFLIALLVRAAWGTVRLATASDPTGLEFPDEQQYWTIASSLASGSGLIDELGFRATRMPLYPALLALFTRLPWGVIAAKGMHWLLGATIPVLTAWLARRLLDRKTACLAGLLAALDPFFVFISSLLLTETLFLAALLLLWCVSGTVGMGRTSTISRRRWFEIGLAAALVVHAREAGLVFAGALLLAIWCARRFELKTFGGLALVAAIVAGSLLPWAYRNHTVIGEWRFLTTRAGVSLYDGVRPGADGSSNLGDVQQSQAVRDLTEVQWNRHFTEASVVCIRDEPGRILSLALTKLARTWNPLPNVGTYQSELVRWVSAMWTLPILVFAGVGSIILTKRYQDGADWRAVALLLLPALVVCVLHAVFVGSVRYRLPAMPMIEILAAVGMIQGIGRITRRMRTDRNEPLTADRDRGE
ncbi:MAG: hypothetical protein ACE5E5_14710 [Phycisphaerae bacterium]